ncbi:MAG: hypothetical protein H0U21_03080 [Acidimicrobiia bacterium]|nr:hypothetical protein [Acidimicrobiia bacterium]
MDGGWLPPTPRAPTAPAAPSNDGFWRRFDSMGDHARRRLAPTYDGSLGAGGGLLVALDIAVAAVGDGDARGPVVVVALVLVATGAVIRLTVDESFVALHAAATAFGTVGILAFAAAAVPPDSSSYGTVVLLLATIGYTAAWLFPGYRGHPVILGAGLLSFASLAANIVTSGGDVSSFDAPVFGPSASELRPDGRCCSWVSAICS